MLDGDAAEAVVPCSSPDELAVRADLGGADVVVVSDGQAVDSAWLRTIVTQARVRRCAVVLLASGANAPENALLAARSGVREIACRDRGTRLLGVAVAAARAQQKWVDPHLAAHILMENAPSRLDATIRDRLTIRESEVLGGISAGMSNSEMAEMMTISERTVKFHVSNILAKLGVSSREQAILLLHSTARPVREYRVNTIPQDVGSDSSLP
ncbi:MAG: helix-turn-helix transcriptional regulator [Pseudonocardia sp.]